MSSYEGGIDPKCGGGGATAGRLEPVPAGARSARSLAGSASAARHGDPGVRSMPATDDAGRSA